MQHCYSSFSGPLLSKCVPFSHTNTFLFFQNFSRGKGSAQAISMFAVKKGLDTAECKVTYCCTQGQKLSATSCYAVLLILDSSPYTNAELSVRGNSSKENATLYQGFLCRSPKPAATSTLSTIIIIIANNYQIKLHAEKLLKLITDRNSNNKSIARPRSNSLMTP